MSDRLHLAEKLHLLLRESSVFSEALGEFSKPVGACVFIPWDSVSSSQLGSQAFKKLPDDLCMQGGKNLPNLVFGMVPFHPQAHRCLDTHTLTLRTSFKKTHRQTLRVATRADQMF